MAYTGIRAASRRDSRTDTPALPFCYVTLKGQTSKRIPANYPQFLNTLADHLQKRRLDLGLTWKQVANAIGRRATNVANWSRTRGQPDIRAWPGIIWFLGYDPRPTPMSLGAALKQHRAGQGISQKEFARVLRVDPSTLAKWERNERAPAGEFLARVRDTLRDGGGD